MLEYASLVKEGVLAALIVGFIVGVLSTIAFMAIVILLGNAKDDTEDIETESFSADISNHIYLIDSKTLKKSNNEESAY